MKGVILAAGKGSRLYPVTNYIPKPLLPIANKITLTYAFEQLKKIGVTEICLVVGETEAQMKEILGDGSKYEVQLTYVRQTNPHGLAHAVGFAKEFVGQDDFVLYLGDAIYGGDFVAYRDQFEFSKCANLNLVKPVPDPTRFGVANVEGERMVRLVEKPKNPESNLAMAGLYFFRSEIWEVLPDLKPSARGEYEITDAIQLLIDRGDTVLAGIYKGIWFDTGTLSSFLETSRYFVQEGYLAGKNAILKGKLGTHVVIGEGATVSCEKIENCVVLPGARVHVEGELCHSIVGGIVSSKNHILNQILYGTY